MIALEPVWKDHQTVLVSDSGPPFEASADAGLIWRLQEYIAILSKQVGALRKRWLISDYISGAMEGAYWGIGSDARHYGVDIGFSEELVDDVIAGVRTDLDVFSPAEQAVLENHGYALAEAAIQRHAPTLIAQDAPYQVPNRDWTDEAKVRQALKGSNKRRLLS